MSRTIRIASRLPVPVTLVEPNPNPEKPGLAPTLRSVVVPGARHPGGETVSVIDAEIFGAWRDGNKGHDWLRGDLLREVDADYDPASAAQFGHEPGLEVLAADAENTRLAELGTEFDEHAPVPAEEMDATSDQPNDDSPRSEVGPTSGRRGRAVKTSDIPGPVPGETA